MRYIGMEEVGWWGDPREGFILTKPYMARRHVRQTDAPGSTGATFLQPFSAQTLTLISSCSGAAMLRTLGVHLFARQELGVAVSRCDERQNAQDRGRCQACD